MRLARGRIAAFCRLLQTEFTLKSALAIFQNLLTAPHHGHVPSSNRAESPRCLAREWDCRKKFVRSRLSLAPWLPGHGQPYVTEGVPRHSFLTEDIRLGIWGEWVIWYFRILTGGTPESWENLVRQIPGGDFSPWNSSFFHPPAPYSHPCCQPQCRTHRR